MTFLKKALGSFIEFDEAKTPSQQAIVTLQQNPVGVIGQTAQFPRALGTADIEKFAAHFEKLFADSNMPGPDYFEFSKAVEALAPHIPVEAARMQAAFTSFAVQGLSKEHLVKTANQYIAIVQADRAEIEKAADAKNKEEIAPLNEQYTLALNEVEADEARIKALQDGLAAKGKKADDLQAELIAAKKRLGTNIEGAQAASAAMVQRIQADIKKITDTL